MHGIVFSLHNTEKLYFGTHDLTVLLNSIQPKENVINFVLVVFVLHKLVSRTIGF